jgi:UDP-N-acetylglucosamine transferase subunit ALG13
VDLLKVLITIGSMVEKKFTRLLKIIDELCEEKILDGTKVIAQIGFDNYVPKHYRSFDMISDEKFKSLIDEVDLIISHAGTGTVVPCLKKGKKVILFPRMAKYNEHYDDHQFEIAELFTLEKYTLCAKDKQELIRCINMFNTFTPRKFISNNAKMNKLIINFIENQKSDLLVK